MIKHRRRSIIALLSSAIMLSSAIIYSTASAAEEKIQKQLPDHHACTNDDFSRENPNLCSAIRHLIAPDTSRNTDIISIPHRGLWGGDYGEGPSENTLSALKAAHDRGYRIIEIDAALTDVSPDNGEVYLGHYFNRNAFNPQIDPRTQSITNVQMKRRSMRPGKPGQGYDNLTRFSEALAWAKENQVLLMVDPKVPANPIDGEYPKIIANVVKAALNSRALANIAIKTDRRFKESTAYIYNIVGIPYNTIAGTFLWSPIVNKDAGTGVDETIENYNDWQSHTGNGSDIAMYEIGVFGTCHWTGKPISTLSRTFDNLIDFILYNTDTPIRPSLWSADAASYLGTLSREYTWKMIGNNNACRVPKIVDGQPDMRGDPFSTLSNSGASYTAINTDMPEFYSQLSKE